MKNSKFDPQAQSSLLRSTGSEEEKSKSYDYLGYIDTSSEDYDDILNPCWLTGFSSGESTFVITIYRDSRMNTGWAVQPFFAVTLHKKDYVILKKFQEFFGGAGSISKDRKDYAQYKVYSKADLAVVINHFNKYPLLTQKKADFELFKSAVELINRKEHLTLNGLKKIVTIRASMNRGLTTVLITAFPDLVPAPKQKIVDQEIYDPNLLSGFVAAEGSFMVSLKKSPHVRVGFSVWLRFSVSQDSRDAEFMASLVNYFGCGKYYLAKNRESGDFVVQNFSDIWNKIIPFFDKHQILGVKAKDFEDWKIAAKLVAEKEHLTESGLEKIRQIRLNMNSRRL